MRLATLRTDDGHRAVRVEDKRLIDLGVADVGALLRRHDWRQLAAQDGAAVHGSEGASFAPVVPQPSKVICVGLNYRNHILEMGRDLPDHPTLFAKFADTLIGPTDDIEHPSQTTQLDWEAELAVVIGQPVRHASTAEAEKAIAGFTVLNDITCRDWQNRTVQWLQGKMWDRSTPVGPHLVTPDELPGGVRPKLDLRLTVDGELMQSNNTGELLFDPVHLVSYVSTIVRLNPGDLISTGTPGGVGHARKPARYLKPGQRVVTELAGLGRLDNRIVASSETK